MKLAEYISDLLYRYECVIIPDFGGFVTNNKSARINSFSNTFYPPYKQITFNGHLKNNDGLLANYVASIEKIPYDSALNYIKFEVEEWFNRLQNEDIDLENIGIVSLQNNTILFEPHQKINYLTSSFGLANVVSNEIKREASEEAPVISITQEHSKAPEYLKYAAIFILGLSALGIGGRMYRNYHNQQNIVVAEEKQKEIEQKIENATFVISKPLPYLNLTIGTVDQKMYHIIAGAFRFPENAAKKLNQLKTEGYNARILGVNKWGLTIVSFDSYESERDAINSLNRIKRREEKKAWLLVQKF